ncbi:MAG TPA: VWA domain-containing protein [Pyrinomonadaceae bacterium]|nr:VWA domain-containing protein [Pyrinomonadaceae bacterium]
MRLALFILSMAALLIGLPVTGVRAQTSPRSAKRKPPRAPVKICKGVSIPEGYTVIAETTSPACPGGAYVIQKEPAAAAAAPPDGPAAQQQPAPPTSRPSRVTTEAATDSGVSPAQSAGQPPALKIVTAPASSPSTPPAPPSDSDPLEVGEGDVVRVYTDLVTVPVSVFDRQGRAITDLGRQEFRIFENGVEQEIAYFEPTEKPFTVALLLDTSASTSFRLSDIKKAAIAFARQLQPQDQVLVVTFDDEVMLLTEATNDQDKISVVINVNAHTGNTTRLYDALDVVIRERLDKLQGRKAIVLFTDGVDTASSQASYESTIREVEELDALVFPIQYDTFEELNAATGGGVTVTPGRNRGPFPGGPRLPRPTYSRPSIVLDPLGITREEYERAGRYLRALAEKSGGQLYSADDPQQLALAFSQIAEELRRQYSLGYYPKQPLAGAGERRQIKVRVGRPDLAVRARDGYAAKSNDGPR